MELRILEDATTSIKASLDQVIALSIGAGMILKSAGDRIHGLTTAAGIWVVGAIGLAIGSGMYLVGLACAIVAALVLLSERVLRLEERLARRRSERDERHE